MKPTVPEVLPRVREFCRKHPVACCLHIALDDGNIDDDSLRFCIGVAEEKGHDECKALAEVLLTMSKTQRLKLQRQAWKKEDAL